MKKARCREECVSVNPMPFMYFFKNLMRIYLRRGSIFLFWKDTWEPVDEGYLQNLHINSLSLRFLTCTVGFIISYSGCLWNSKETPPGHSPLPNIEPNRNSSYWWVLEATWWGEVPWPLQSGRLWPATLYLYGSEGSCLLLLSFSFLHKFLNVKILT